MTAPTTAVIVLDIVPSIAHTVSPARKSASNSCLTARRFSLMGSFMKVITTLTQVSIPKKKPLIILDLYVKLQCS